MNRYSVTGTRVVENTQVRRSVAYPEIAPTEEDYYVITSTGDRFDILAKQFYGDQTYWWVIASANPNVRRDSLAIDPGVQLRIPPLRTILESYEQLNRSR